MARPDVLIMNSYAGSLTLAASSLNLKIRGSYEDAGYGLSVQRANFPKLRYVERLPWPKDDLDDTVVIAHPPCAAFSKHNVGKHKAHVAGVDAEAFQCTRRVLDYAMGSRARAVLVESVPRALEGARAVHDEFGQRYGYHVYRILQNAASFGVAQWRERFWVVFVRAGGVKGKKMEHVLPLNLTPRYTQVGRVIIKPNPGDPLPDNEKEWRVQRGMAKDFGVPLAALDNWLTEEGGGRLSDIAWRSEHRLLSKLDREEVPKRVFGRAFHNAMLTVLNLEGFAPTLLGNQTWVADGRLVGRHEYKELMGFPRDYIFPDKTVNKMKEYLSKGVCPPVASWLLDQVVRYVTGAPTLTERTQFCAPGEVLDLRPKKSYVMNILRQKEMFAHE